MTAISDYFRTALLIDDRVAADYEPFEPRDSEQAKGKEREPDAGLVKPSEADETPVHPAELVRAFFASGVVCSVLEPDMDSTDMVEEALRGAQIADLLILDWLLYGSHSLTLDMIRAIASKRAERLTVIVVFTGTPSLGDVVQRLVDEAEFETADEYTLRRGNTVVLVFGKPGRRLIGGEDRRQPSGYGDLPGMICSDLELIFKGLMPELAFGGINALRESAPRILATFNAELDAGALIHRALLPEPSDAATQFVRLLASDFEQILHDGRVGDLWHIDSSSSVLTQSMATASLGPLAERLRSSEAVQNALGKLGPLSAEALVHEAMSQGLCRLGLNDRAIRKAIPDLTDAFIEADESNRRLAAMMDSAGLGETPPRLELGVVLRRESATPRSPEANCDEEQRPWLCVQPLCDSVRLQAPRDFPLIPVCTDLESPGAMIRSVDGVLTGVSFVTDLHQLRQVLFAPTVAGAVVADGSPPDWHFTDVEGETYRVITRLRSGLAAQVVQSLGSDAARVGTDQSEWLRRGARS